MKKNILVPFLFLSTLALAQEKERWKINLDDKTLLQSFADDTGLSPIILQKAKIKNARKWNLVFTKNLTPKDWTKHVQLINTQDSVLYEATGNSRKSEFNWDMQLIIDLLLKGDKIIIYSWVTPDDTELALRVRIRRYKIAEIILQ